MGALAEQLFAKMKGEKKDDESYGVGEMEFEDAAEDVMSAVKSGDSKAFRTALRACIKACK